MRRRVLLLVSLCLLAALLVPFNPGTSATATPVATDDATYGAFGRVFPDPHGCVRGAPAKSPWAKGNVCAVQFVQYQEALDGLAFLESRYDRYLDVLNLSELSGEERKTAGLPREDLSRDQRDLMVVKVTDAESPVPEADRRHFAYSLSIHGIERAGLEGGIRAIEDLVTWAACEDDDEANDSAACEAEGPFPKPILEPSQSGPTAGEVVRDGVVYFVLSNPDGWRRGDAAEGGVFYQRYNGNGMDLNRDFPSVGYTEAPYTPLSEPETRGYTEFLKSVSEKTSDGRFAGAIDLHGMVTAPAFSFTLLGAGQRDYRKNAITVETAVLTFRDSEARLSWSPLIASSDSCPGPIEEPAYGGTVPMCSDQWGTVWDTINYQVTGSFGDWMDSPIGLDAVGIDNEMALSHLAPNNAFVPDVEQLHIDGNKGLIYSQITALLHEQPVQYLPPGRIAYLDDGDRLRHAGGGPAAGRPEHPVQAPIEEVSLNGIQDFTFEVEPGQGGLTVEATFGNVRGISPASFGELSLEYCGPPEHPGDPEGECREVASYFNQSFAYAQSGARIDLNDPKPGPYRIAANQARLLPTRFLVTFSEGPALPIPEQAAYDVSNTDFFTELNRYVPAGSSPLTRVTSAQLAADPAALSRFHTLVLANQFPAEAADELRAWVEAGGTLVLTDAALAGLPALGIGVPAEAIGSGVYYAGWMDFDDGRGPTYDRHPLAAGVDKEGAAEGVDTVDGHQFDHRHQTYEPVPLGYYVSSSGTSNSQCTSDRCDSPSWIVDQAAWEAAGGSVAARTLVRVSEEPGSDSRVGVSLGELPVGHGVIRIAGSLLPDPTEANYHPFGLASYALTYTGYQVFENLVR